MIGVPSTVVNKWLSRDFELIGAVANIGSGLVDLWEASPVRLNSNEPNTDKIIDLLFPGNPLLCCGWSRHRFDTRTRANWYKLQNLQFIVPSPMIASQGLTREGKLSAHVLSNTGPRRFLIVEFDFMRVIRRRSALTEDCHEGRCKRMRGIAPASRGEGATRLGGSQRGKIPARMVLLRGCARRKSAGLLQLRCLVRS